MKVLNYQGSKNKLLQFIDDNMSDLLSDNKALLDIFSGGASVSYYFSKKTKVYSNDLEPYAFHIANYALNNTEKLSESEINQLLSAINKHNLHLQSKLKNLLVEERSVLETGFGVEDFYNKVPTLWNGGISNILNGKITSKSIKERKEKYCLFTLLYSANYFGLKQAIEIDSIIAAIKTVFGEKKSFLYVCLFAAMNSCVFSKDGHMAQPLNISKNLKRCLKVRNKSIYSIFSNLITEEEISARNDNKSFNLEFEELLLKIDPQEVGCVYADPPYTDMQYSRYYHLLNVACEYVFADPTCNSHGFSAGLYLSNRRQSGISVRKTFLPKMKKLMVFCLCNKINLVISFGYPSKKSEEKTDRYLSSIDNLFDLAKETFGESMVSLIGQNYQHSNQRNSSTKKVIEYLIVCRGANNA